MAAAGSPQFAENKVIELAVSRLEHALVVGVVFALGIDLSADVVDAGHILSLESPEIMAQGGGGAAVVVVVLNHMTDILYAVLPAPVAELIGEIFSHQAADGIHEGVAHLGGQIVIRVIFKEQGEHPAGVAVHFLRQIRFQFLAPGIVADMAVGIVPIVEMAVAQFRLVGEEPGDGGPEIRLIVLPVRLIDGVDQDMAGTGVHHVDIGAVKAHVSGEMQGVDFPVSLGDFPVQLPVRNHRREIDPPCGIGKTVGVLVPADGPEGEQAVVVKDAARLFQNKILDHIFLEGIGMGDLLRSDMEFPLSPVGDGQPAQSSALRS